MIKIKGKYNLQNKMSQYNVYHLAYWSETVFSLSKKYLSQILKLNLQLKDPLIPT